LLRPRDAARIALHFAFVPAGARFCRTGQLLLFVFVRARLQPCRHTVPPVVNYLLRASPAQCRPLPGRFPALGPFASPRHSRLDALAFRRGGACPARAMRHASRCNSLLYRPVRNSGAPGSLCFFYAVISVFGSPVGLRRSPVTGPEGAQRPKDLPLATVPVPRAFRPRRLRLVFSLSSRTRSPALGDGGEGSAFRSLVGTRRGAAYPARAMRHASRRISLL